MNVRTTLTKGIARAVLALFTAQTLLATGPASAQVASAPTAISGQKPLIDAAANGVPIVHIAPPSRAGVSRNQYQEFNVQPGGLILNNSTGSVQTQQGGWIGGNLQLGPTPARIVLNEVVGPNASQLRGTIEVAGTRADIVIANPNGISCDGCGFLNTAGRTSLVAGQPRFGEGGSLDGFQTGQGSIHVGPGGLNAAEQDQLDLIARGLVIEGEVWARNLKVIAGANHVLYGTLVATAQPAGTAGTAPLFAVDIKQLGGMYANQVYLMATEQGLGVNSSGRVAALQGNLVLSGQGDLSLNDSYAKGDVQLNAQGKVTLSGQTLSEANIRVTAASGLSNQGATQAAGQLAITTPSLGNSGLLVQRASTDLVIETPAGFENSGTVYGAGNVRVGTSGLTGTGGRLLAGGHLEVAAQTVAVSEQTLAADGNVRVSASQLRAGQSTLRSGSSLALDSGGRLDVGGSAVNARQILTLQASGDIDLSRGEALAGEQVSLSGQNVHTAGAVVAAPKVAVEAVAGSLDNSVGRLLAASGDADALRIAARNVNNTSGELRTNGGLSLDAGSGTLNNTGGMIASHGGTLTGLAGLLNSGGVIYTTSDLSLSSPGFDNSNGVVASAGSLSVASAGQAIRNSGGNLQAGGNLTLDSGTGAIDSAASTLIAGGLFRARGGIVNLDGATVAAGRDANIEADSISGSSSTVAIDGALQLYARRSADFSNAAVSAASGLAAEAQDLQATGAQVVSGGQLRLQTESLRGGTWSAAGNASIFATGRADLGAGGLIAGGDASVRAEGISTDAAQVGGNNVSLHAGTGAYTNVGGSVVARGTGATALQVLGLGIDNSGGTLASAGGAVLDARGQTLNNTGGNVQVVGTLQVSGGHFLNRGGTLATGDSIAIRGQALDNTGGTLQTSGQLSIDTEGRLLDNTSGRLLAQGDASIAASELRNSGGIIAANGGTSVRADNLDTSSGRISGTGALEVAVAQHLTGNAAVLLTQGAMQVSAGSATLVGATAQAGQSLAFSTAGTLDLDAATLSAVGPLSVHAQDALRLAGGVLLADGDLQVRGSVLTASGLQAQTLGRLDLGATSGSVTVDGATLIAGGMLDIEGQGVTAQSAGLAAIGSVNVQAGNGAFDGAGIHALSETGDIAVTAGGALSTRGGLLATTGSATLRGASLDNEGGRIEGTAALAVTLGQGKLNNNAGLIQTAGSLDLHVGSFDNRGGAVLALGSLAVRSGPIDTSGGTLAARVDLQLDTQGGSLDATGARIISAGDACVIASGTTKFAGAQVLAGRDLSIDAGSPLDFNSFVHQFGRDLTVRAQGISNTGNQLVGRNLLLDARSGLFDNSGGTLNATGSLRLVGGTVLNAAGVISGLDSVAIAGALNNDAGVIEAGSGGISIDTAGAQLVNTNSGSARGIVSSGNVGISAGAIANQAGYIGAGGSLAISQSSALDNRGGVLTGLGSTSIASSGGVDNRAGIITSDGDVSLAAAGLDNSGTHDGSWRLGLLAGNNLSITTATVNNASGAIAALGDASVRATASLNNSGGRIAGNTVTVDAASFTNTAGRVDARERLTARVPQFSADGVLASSGSLELQTGGDYTNGGTVAATGDLAISTTGRYTNNGTVSTQGNLTLSSSSLDNNSGGQIVSQSTTLNVAGTVNNAGLINSSNGATTINAATLNNTGRIYGDSLVLNASINNSGGAAIASRAGDIAVRGNLSNSGLSDVVGLRDLYVQGNVTNQNATISAARNMSVSGALNNVNAGLMVGAVTTTESINQLYIRPKDSGTRYAQGELGWSNMSPGYYVLPSTTYPIAQFGAVAKPVSTAMVCWGNTENGECSPIHTYGPSDPAWELFGVTPPSSPLVSPDASGCMVSVGETEGQVGTPERSYAGSCGSYWSQVDTYAQLDARINAFNTDLNSRTLVDWYETQITYREISKPVVTLSQPGVIRAGGSISAGTGSVNRDSAIVAGGTVSGSIINIASEAQQTATEYGQERLSWREWHGGFSSRYSRNYEPWQVTSGGTVSETVKLDTLSAPSRATAAITNTLAGATPSAQLPSLGAVVSGVRVGAGGNAGAGAVPTLGVVLDAATGVPLPGSVVAVGVRAGQTQSIEAVRTNVASQVAARPLSAVAAGTVGARQPAPPAVKADGYTTATSTGRLETPASQLFRINAAPAARYLVETDPAFTNYRQWLSSDWMQLQLSLDPERNLKRYGDGFAEQRLVDDQVFALTGQRFLSGYSSTEAEYQDLLNAGVLYARQYQLTPGVALTAQQMALLTTDIVWLEVQAVVLPDGSITQALVPKVYLRRPAAGDLTRSGAIISASSIDLRNPGGDLVNSGTLYAHGGVEGGAGSLSLQAANISNSGTLAGNQIGVQATGDISHVGGQAIGLGTGSAIGYGAGGNIILQTTTHSGSQSLLGAKGTTQVSRTNVDRVASIAADSVTLAALGNIDFTGAKVNATNSLNIAAAGAISANAVRDTYAIDIPLGGSLRGNTGNVRIGSVTNVGSQLTAGTDLSLNAGAAVTLIGSTASATGTVAISGQSVTIEAAKDLQSLDQTAVKRKGYTRFAESNETLSGGIVAAGGTLVVTAQDDITAKGAVISSSDGLAALVAGGNVNIENMLTEHSLAQESFSKSKGFLSKKSSLTEDAQQTSQVEGSVVQGASVLVSAGNNLSVTGSTVSAAGNATLAADNDIIVRSAAEVVAGTYFHEEKKSGLTASIEGIGWGKSSANQAEQFQATTQVGSLVSGANVNIAAGRDAAIAASAAVADEGLAITAGRNIELQTRDDILQSRTEARASSTYIGLASTYLTPRVTLFNETKNNEEGNSVTRTAVESLLSANQGNLTLSAGADSQYRATGQGNVVTQGATLLAGETVSVTGNRVTLGTADSASASQFHMDTKSVTVGAQLAGTVGSQITRVYDAVVESTRTDNDRLAGALALKGTYDAAKLASNWDAELAKAGAIADAAAANKVDDPATSPFGVSFTLGTSKSSFDSTQDATSRHGTVIQAASIQINATAGDLSATGAKLQATRDASLSAAGAIQLQAAQNTTQIEQHNQSSSASVGLTFGFGQQNGISFQAGASKGQGNAQASETTWDNTLVTAGGTVSLKSGGDTTLTGAQVVGSTVKADVGGQLNIQSLQDESDFHSEQKSSGWGVSLCIPPFCYGTSSASVSSAQQQIDHSYQSATGQSGIAAGEGGFQVNVQGTTTLTGGAITSQAGQDKNTLRTAGITYTDLTNTQNTHASSSSFSASTSASAAASLTNNLLGNLAGQVGLPESGSQSATTLSVISPANITITGTGDATANQQSRDNVATLTSRDASTANGSLVNTLTLDQARQLQEQIRKAQEDARAAQLIGSVIDEKIGDIAKENNWAEGSTEKTILHGLSGAIQAGIAGGNIVVGAASGALNEQLVPVTKDYLVANGIKEGTREFDEFMALGSTLAGAAVGAAAGGTQGAATGGWVAYTGTVNNYLKHTEQVARYSADRACRSGDQKACQTKNELDALSQQRQADMVQACVAASADACRMQIAIAGVDYYEMYLYGKELDKHIAAATDPALVKELKAIKAQNEIHMAQVANVIKTDLEEIKENKGGLSAGERNLLGGLNAAGTGQGAADALMGAGITTTASLRGMRPVVKTGGASNDSVIGPATNVGSSSDAPGSANVGANNDAVGPANVGTSINAFGPAPSAGRAAGELGNGVRLYPDGSLRTADGKFASLAGSPAPGTVSAANYADFLSLNGINVVGKEMVVSGPLGPRRYDIVVQDAAGNLQGIEIKTGGATRDPYQQFTDMHVNRFGIPGVGRLAGRTVTSTITIYLP